MSDRLRDLEEQYESLQAALLDMQRQRDLGEDLLRGCQEQLEAAHYALERITTLQDNALRYIETNGFVFDDIGKEPGNWKHLAFSLYTDLCEADTLSHAALDLPLGESPASDPAISPTKEDEHGS